MGNKLLNKILDWEASKLRERPDLNPYFWVNPFWDESFTTTILHKKVHHGFPTDTDISLDFIHFRKKCLTRHSVLW